MIRVFMERGVARVMNHAHISIVYIAIKCQDTVRNAAIIFGVTTVIVPVRYLIVLALSNAPKQKDRNATSAQLGNGEKHVTSCARKTAVLVVNLHLVNA